MDAKKTNKICLSLKKSVEFYGKMWYNTFCGMKSDRVIKSYSERRRNGRFSDNNVDYQCGCPYCYTNCGCSGWSVSATKVRDQKRQDGDFSGLSLFFIRRGFKVTYQVPL